MTIKPMWVVYYLLAGVIVQIIGWHSVNIFDYHLWLHIIFWLPILAFWIMMHFIRLVFWLVFAAVLLICLASIAFPQVRNFVSYTIGNIGKRLGLA